MSMRRPAWRFERFFWSDLCDNYLELVKARLYGEPGPARYSAQWSLYHALLTVLKLLAPHLPYITEEIYQGLFRQWESAASIHRATWPAEQPTWIDLQAEETGKTLLELLRQVRRYKAEQGLSVGAELASLNIQVASEQLTALETILSDIRSATRAKSIVIEQVEGNGQLPQISIAY